MDASCVQLHHQEIMTSSQSLDNIIAHTKPQIQIQNQQQKQEMEDKKARAALELAVAARREEALKCPRCDSSNTKFCYYNNYSLTQPRYFCKSCRRYWTKGGTLRNVPVGGGCRKNKRCSSIKRNHHDLIITSPNHFSPQLLTSYESVNNWNDFITTAHNGGNGNGILAFFGNTHFDLFGGGNDNHHFNIGVGSDLYYGGGNNVNLMSQDEDHQQQQMGMHFDLLQLQSQHQEIMSGSNPSSGSSTPTIEEEFELGGDGNRLLLNYIMNGGGGGGGDDNAPKESWNGGGGVLGSTSWHNLINSPLM